MIDFWTTDSTFSMILTMAFWLLVVYLLLHFVRSGLRHWQFLGRYKKPVQRAIRDILLVYELIVILALSGAFVMANPFYHGMMLLVVIVGSYWQVRNYLSGRIIQFDRTISLGNRLRVKDEEGLISEMGRLGIKLRTRQGLRFVNYHEMLQEGYLLIAGDEIGGFYNLLIEAPERTEKVNERNELEDLFFAAPYLDRLHKPEILPVEGRPDTYNVQVAVQEERHLRDLMALIRERGYTCNISNR